MAKKNSNSGFVRQGAIMSQFSKEAKAPISSSNAVAQCIKGRKAAEAPKMSFKFLATGK